MLSKNEVKDIQSLRHKKFREESGVFVAEGPKMVSELATLIPDQISCIYTTEIWAAEQAGLLKHLSHKIITEADLERISQLQTPNQVVAVLKQFKSILPEAKNNFCLYLDALQDPGNFGTIIRIADWFGLKNIVCSEGCADMYNAKVVQATMSSIARVNIYYDKEMHWLQQQTVPVYAALLNGQSLYDFPKTEEGILMIGNESKGIRPELLPFATQRITIPRKGHAESLNAAVATGIILSHLVG